MNDDPMNPYAAPKAEIQPISHDEDLQDASGTKRFLNFIIDRIVGMAFAFLVFLLMWGLPGCSLLEEGRDGVPLLEQLFSAPAGATRAQAHSRPKVVLTQ